MPAFTLWRRWYLGICRLNSSMNTGRSGRGPTRLMSPRSTLKSCGSSSSDVSPEEGPDRGPPVVAGGRHPRARLLGVDPHGPELEDGEHRPIHPHPLLPVEHRPAAGQLHRQGHHQHHRRDDEQRQRREQDVEGALGDQVPALQRSALEADDGQPAELLQAAVERHVLEEVGDDLHVHGAQREPLHQRLQQRHVLGREREDHLVHRLLVEDLLQLVGRPDDRHATHRGPGQEEVAGEDAGDPEAELAVVLDGLHHPLAQLAGPDQEDGLEVQPPPAQRLEPHPEGHPGRRHQDEGVAGEEEPG